MFGKGRELMEWVWEGDDFHDAVYFAWLWLLPLCCIKHNPKFCYFNNLFTSWFCSCLNSLWFALWMYSEYVNSLWIQSVDLSSHGWSIKSNSIVIIQHVMLMCVFFQRVTELIIKLICMHSEQFPCPLFGLVPIFCVSIQAPTAEKMVDCPIFWLSPN